MTKNNLKVVKTDNKKQQELKEKNKSLEAAISSANNSNSSSEASSNLENMILRELRKKP